MVLPVTLFVCGFILTACGVQNSALKITFIVEDEVYYTTTGNSDSLITFPQNPYKEGFDFVGWYTDGQVNYSFNFLEKQSSSGELTVFAKWKAIEYNIYYNLGIGSNHLDNPVKYTAEQLPLVIKAAVAPDRWEFTGWTDPFSDSLQKTVIIPAGTMGDITLNANWERELIILH